MPRQEPMFCTRCHEAGWPDRRTNPAAWVLVVLGVLLLASRAAMMMFSWRVVLVLAAACILGAFVLPGREVCPECGSSELIPEDSPRARRLHE